MCSRAGGFRYPFTQIDTWDDVKCSVKSVWLSLLTRWISHTDRVIIVSMHQVYILMVGCLAGGQGFLKRVKIIHWWRRDQG